MGEYFLGNGDNDDLGEDDYVGEDELLGAIRKFQGRGNVRGNRRVLRKPAIPYTDRPGAQLRSYLGFGAVTFTGTDGTDKTTIVEPQEAFRGERLIIDTVDSAAALGLPLLRRLDVGSQPQSPSVEFAMPASAFRPDSTYSGVDLQTAMAGVKISCVLGVTAPPGGAVVRTMSAGLFGNFIR